MWTILWESRKLRRHLRDQRAKYLIVHRTGNEALERIFTSFSTQSKLVERLSRHRVLNVTYMPIILTQFVAAADWKEAGGIPSEFWWIWNDRPSASTSYSKFVKLLARISQTTATADDNGGIKQRRRFAFTIKKDHRKLHRGDVTIN